MMSKRMPQKRCNPTSYTKTYTQSYTRKHQQTLKVSMPGVGNVGDFQKLFFQDSGLRWTCTFLQLSGDTADINQDSSQWAENPNSTRNTKSGNKEIRFGLGTFIIRKTKCSGFSKRSVYTNTKYRNEVVSMHACSFSCQSICFGCIVSSCDLGIEFLEEIVVWNTLCTFSGSFLYITDWYL